MAKRETKGGKPQKPGASRKPRKGDAKAKASDKDAKDAKGKKDKKGKATAKAVSSAKKATPAKKGRTLTAAGKKVTSEKFSGSKAKKKTPKATPVSLEPKTANVFSDFSLFTDFDIHLFRQGKHARLYEKLGSHVCEHNGTKGTYFAVWAPNAESVSVVGNFNFWDAKSHPLYGRWDASGIWEGFLPGIGHGEVYKYSIQSTRGFFVEKGDPFAHYWEEPPKTASIIWELNYEWKDSKWLEARKNRDPSSAPMSVYEVHLGSWRRKLDEGNRSLSYGELSIELVDYVREMGYTHVEFMPVMEHPFFGSWGYQITGYFAPSSRFGNPQDFMYLVDKLHEANIGVILDWVPSHFPGDVHGLGQFDGTHLYEHADPRKGFHPDWKSFIFNYGRSEVRSFLISNAIFWLDQFHIDGLRVDAVASMLYLDYSRKDGEWIPNEYGGNENIEAITFLKEFNETVYGAFPDTVTIAEESTSWAMVSRPTYLGGLGFGQKWMMGWMHDTLEYFKRDPIYRRFHQNEITFSIMYAFTENFALPLSHDEVVHGKGSLLGKMPGDQWQKFANLRLLFGYMFAHPGTKLVFMGGEIGQYAEWNHDSGLDWYLLDQDLHKQLQSWVKNLNTLYKSEPALHQLSFDYRGFEWLDYSDHENSVLSFIRKSLAADDSIVVVMNMTPSLKPNYRIGVPNRGQWEEIATSDDQMYGGSGVVNQGKFKTVPVRVGSQDHSIAITLPPLGICMLKKVIGEGDNLELSGS